MTTQRSLIPIVASCLMIVGLGLLALGWAWRAIVPSTVYWGPREAEEYAAAQADLHAESHSHDSQLQHQQNVAAAQERFNKISQQLERARDSRNHMGTYLTGAGILLLVTGIGTHLAIRQSG